MAYSSDHNQGTSRLDGNLFTTCVADRLGEARRFGQLKSILCVASVCLIVRIAYLGTVDRLPPLGPYDGYVEIAQNILGGKGLSPTPLHQFFLRTPTYPLFIAGVWSVTPTSLRYLSLALVQVCLSVGTCVLIYALAYKLFCRRSAVAAAMLFALSPSYTIYARSFILRRCISS